MRSSNERQKELYQIAEAQAGYFPTKQAPSLGYAGVPLPRILRLHYGRVAETEQEVLFSVPVTNALRTILDVWEEDSLPKAILRQAFEQARRSGKVTRKQAFDLLHDSRFASLARELVIGSTPAQIRNSRSPKI